MTINQSQRVVALERHSSHFVVWVSRREYIKAARVSPSAQSSPWLLPSALLGPAVCRSSPRLLPSALLGPAVCRSWVLPSAAPGSCRLPLLGPAVCRPSPRLLPSAAPGSCRLSLFSPAPAVCRSSPRLLPSAAPGSCRLPLLSPAPAVCRSFRALPLLLFVKVSIICTYAPTNLLILICYR